MKKLLILTYILFSFGPLSAQKGSVCNAAFSFMVMDEISIYTIQFINLSTSDDSIVTYKWDFGDGHSSTNINPHHQYLEVGHYPVTLTIKTSNGCTHEFTDTLHLAPVTPPATCIASASYYAISGSPFTFGFKDHSSGIDTADKVIAWVWDFNDGSPLSYSQNPTHQYSTTGLFQVSLTITTTSNCSKTTYLGINVTGSAPPCLADFDITPDSLNPLKFKFHDASISSTGALSSWEWTYGDGDTTRVRDTSHVFPFNGIYDIELRINTTTGCKDTLTLPLVVGNPQKHNMWGHVYAGPYPIDHCIAYLYKNFNNKLYVPTDTVELTSINDTLGVYYFYQKYEGEYLVKLMLPSTSAYANQFVPTYFGNTIFWQNADNLSLFNDLSHEHIYLKEEKDFDQTIGNAFISGNIDNSSNPTQTNSNAVILLLNAQGQAVDYTLSNASGNFQFENIPFGNYYITSDITGLKRIPMPIELSNTTDSITNVQLFIHPQIVMGFMDHPLEDSYEKLNIDLYPNPAQHNIHIQVPRNDNYTVEVYNVLGRKTIEKRNQWISTESPLTLSLDALPSGVYLLHLIGDDKSVFAARKFIKR